MDFEHYILAAGVLTVALVLVAVLRLVFLTDYFAKGLDHDNMRSEFDKERDVVTLGCLLVFIVIPAGVLLFILYFY